MTANAVTNRVFYFTGPRKWEIRDEPCPPPGPGQIRAKTICSMVSIGTESICYVRDVEKGSNWDKWIEYPFHPGYLTVGEVTEVGAGVTDIKPGERVYSGVEHRAWFIEEARKAMKIPDGLSSEEACWTALNTVVQLGIREVGPEMGQVSVVIGLGPLGQLAVRLLGLCGQTHVIAVDPIAARCEMAKGHGATVVLAGNADQTEEKIKELTRGRGADNVFDITGNPAVFHLAHRLLCRRGKLGLIGDVPKPTMQTLTHDVLFKSISIVGSHGITALWEGNDFFRWGRKQMAEFFYDMILAKRINLKNLFTHRIKPTEAGKIYDDLQVNRGAYMGIIIDWT